MSLSLDQDYRSFLSQVRSSFLKQFENEPFTNREVRDLMDEYSEMLRAHYEDNERDVRWVAAHLFNTALDETPWAEEEDLEPL